MRFPKYLTLFATLLILLPTCWLMAQSEAVGPVYGTATRHDVSPRLDEMALPIVVPTGAAIEIPMGERVRTRPSGGPGDPDPLRQTEAQMASSLQPTPAPLFTFPGLTDDDNAVIVGTRVVPPDTEGDVGKDYYVQWVNLIFAIYDKNTGAIITGGGPFPGNAIWNGFGGVCQSTNNGDPIVLYDHLAGRWVFTQFAINFGVQCIAISQTGDPRGPYDRWQFTVSPSENNDYPKLGVMPESYFFSFRDFPSSNGLASAVAFDRRAMLAGDASPRFVKFGLPCLTFNCVDGFQPPHLEGPPPPTGTPGVYSKIWDDNFDGPLTGADGYRLWNFTVDWSVAGPSPPASFVELPFTAGAPFNNDMCGFFNRNCVPQASSTQRLDPIDELQMYRAQLRHWGTYNSLVINTTVDATGGDIAGVRWAELRNSGSGWTIHQEGTYAPADGLNRWMGSAAMDGDGNIALGYSASSSSSDPSIRYTTRSPGDALGTFPNGEQVMQAGGGAQTGANRWGDYSAMSVDPVDDCTFYYTQEYYANTGSFDFATRVGAFILTGCNTNRCGNGFCQPGESCDGSGTGNVACPADCDIQGTGGGAVCGNGVCEAGDGENCLTCAADCNGKQNGKPANRFCCGDGTAGEGAVTCADARCTTGGFQCNSNPVGGGGTIFCCGDGVCDPSGGECGLCDQDCSRSSVCASGGGGCSPSGASCTANNQCCSGNCKGKPGSQTCK